MTLALFDLDGCLVDSNRAITTALVYALDSLGIDGHDPAQLTWCVGPPLVESVATLLARSDADVALVPEVVDRYRERYRAFAVEQTQVVPGIPGALDTLEAEGARLAVVTSKPGPIAGPLLEGLGLRDRFEAVHAPDADHRAEPKTATLRRALDDLDPGGDPSRAVMIGDRSHDVVAGLACGTGTVGVTWGAGSREELELAGAASIVDDPSALPRAVTASAGRPSRR